MNLGLQLPLNTQNTSTFHQTPGKTANKPEQAESLKLSVDILGQQMSAFNNCLTKCKGLMKCLMSGNFEKLTKMEGVVESLQSQTMVLLELVADLKKRRFNRMVINIPKGSEKDQDPTKFVSINGGAPVPAFSTSSRDKTSPPLPRTQTRTCWRGETKSFLC